MRLTHSQLSDGQERILPDRPEPLDWIEREQLRVIKIERAQARIDGLKKVKDSLIEEKEELIAQSAEVICNK